MIDSLRVGQSGNEITHKTVKICNGGSGMNGNVWIAINPTGNVGQKVLNIVPFQGKVNFCKQAAQGVISFNQMDTISLICKGKRCSHAGNAAPDNQSCMGDSDRAGTDRIK